MPRLVKPSIVVTIDPSPMAPAGAMAPEVSTAPTEEQLIALDTLAEAVNGLDEEALDTLLGPNGAIVLRLRRPAAGEVWVRADPPS